MSTLEVRNLVQRYTYGAYGINDVSFKTQGILSVLGDTSSGKTSLLKCIAGLYPATSGEIYLNSFNILKEETKNRHLQLISPDEGFFNYKSLFKNLYFPLKIRKIREETARPVIEGACKKLGIEHLLDKKIYLFDEEERALSAFARCLVRKADLVLFDDILKNVQGKRRRELFLFLVPFIKSLDAVVLYATTVADEAFTIGEETMILSSGYLVDMGARESILNSAKSLTSYRYAAGIASNTAKGVIKKENGKIVLNILGKSIPLEKGKILNEIYFDGGEVIAAFLLKMDENGDFMPNESSFLESVFGNSILHTMADGAMLSIPVADSDMNIRFGIDMDTLRIFDAASEKPVYFA